MIDGKTPPSLSPTVPQMGGPTRLEAEGDIDEPPRTKYARRDATSVNTTTTTTATTPPPTLTPPSSRHRGQEGTEVGVASSVNNLSSGGSGGTTTTSPVGAARMSVPRNSPQSVPTSGDTPSRKPVRLCQVCGDIAKSLHFGGLSCDSCKAFFRRSVQNDAYKHFRCGGDQKCAISIASRKFCKYCRFTKCESIGMTKSWVMSEEERLQLMKTRLTKRMMYQQGSSSGGSGGGSGGGSVGGSAGRASNSGYNSSNSCPRDSPTPKDSPTYQPNSVLPTYQPPTHPVDLDSSGSSPNSSPPTPITGTVAPIQYGPIPPVQPHTTTTTTTCTEIIHHQPVVAKEENTGRSLCRGIKRESDDEEVGVERVFNQAARYLNAKEFDVISRVVSNITFVEQELPYAQNAVSDVMSIYQRFAERLTSFLRQFSEFNSLPPVIQKSALQKNITLIALVFASSFLKEETGSYHNVLSPNQPMITNMSMIQKAMSPEVFSKFQEILSGLRMFNVDSRMAYLLVLIIVFDIDGQETHLQNFQRILQQYISWKFGELNGKSIYEGLMRALQGIRRHSELFESMAVRHRNIMTSGGVSSSMITSSVNRHDCLISGSPTTEEVRHMVENMTADQIRQMLNGMDIEQMKQMLQGNGLEQMKQMLQTMESESTHTQDGTLISSPPPPPPHCNSPQSMVQSPHSMLQSPHSMLPSPHSMLQSPQSIIQSPHSMMESPHNVHHPPPSPGMLQSPTASISQNMHTMLDISHSLSPSPNTTMSQILTATTNILQYQDMKPGAFLNSPQSIDLSQSLIEISSPSPHPVNLAASPAPYIPNQESYILDQPLPEPTYTDRQSPLEESTYPNLPPYPQAPFSPAPLSDQYNKGFQALFSPLPYKEEGQNVSSSSNTSSSGIGLSVPSSLSSPISSLLTSPAPSHSSLHESDNSLSNYQEPEHGNSLGAAP